MSGNVTVLERGDRTFYIVGTAHISERSVQEVKDVIERVRPDTVCVELCKTRFDALTDEERWRRLDIFQVIRQQKVLFLLSNLALSAYQKRLGDKLGVRPGAELLAGVDCAREVGAELVLADRDIQATLKRTWRNLGFMDKVKVLGALSESFLSREEISEETLEQMKERDHLTEIMKEFARVMPKVQAPLIDERDRFLMSSIEDAPGQKVVAVVGAGHVEGMTRYFGQKQDRAALEVIPPPSRWTAVLKWLIPALLIGMFFWGFANHEGGRLQDMLFAWILPTSLLCGLFTLLSGAKLLSVLTGVVGAPITTLHPAIGAGMVVGLVEAWLRKPTVEDCEQVPEAMTSFKGVWRNRFTRVLLVAAASTVGAAMGMWVGASLVTKIFLQST
jgi:pheromone shutdown-related protein TraB